MAAYLILQNGKDEVNVFWGIESVTLQYRCRIIHLTGIFPPNYIRNNEPCLFMPSLMVSSRNKIFPDDHYV